MLLFSQSSLKIFYIETFGKINGLFTEEKQKALTRELY